MDRTDYEDRRHCLQKLWLHNEMYRSGTRGYDACCTWLIREMRRYRTLEEKAQKRRVHV